MTYFYLFSSLLLFTKQGCNSLARKLRMNQFLGDIIILLAPWYISSYQEWHSDLYTEAGLSHAAVIIFSNDMLHDEDVQKTIGLLAARTLNHVDLSKFVFVPVLIDQVQSSNLELANSTLISPELKTFSPIQSNNPAEISSQVLTTAV